MNFSLIHHRRVRGRGSPDPGCRGGGRGGAGGGGHPAPLPAAPAAGPAQRPALAGRLYAETANLWVYSIAKNIFCLFVSKNISHLSIWYASHQYQFLKWIFLLFLYKIKCQVYRVCLVQQSRPTAWPAWYRSGWTWSSSWGRSSSWSCASARCTISTFCSIYIYILT